MRWYFDPHNNMHPDGNPDGIDIEEINKWIEEGKGIAAGIC